MSNYFLMTRDHWFEMDFYSTKPLEKKQLGDAIDSLRGQLQAHIAEHIGPDDFYVLSLNLLAHKEVGLLYHLTADLRTIPKSDGLAMLNQPRAISPAALGAPVIPPKPPPPPIIDPPFLTGFTANLIIGAEIHVLSDKFNQGTYFTTIHGIY
jgi:hypothetical protein